MSVDSLIWLRLTAAVRNLEVEEQWHQQLRPCGHSPNWDADSSLAINEIRRALCNQIIQ